jgi:hypothetical protein
MSAGRKNSQVILPGRLHKVHPHKEQAKACKDQAKLDEIGLWSSFGCPGGQDLGDKAIHNTYSLTHTLSGNFSKEILTEVRAKLGVVHGLPSYQVKSLKPREPSALSIKIDQDQVNHLGKWTGTLLIK